ncbi:MAG TPA: hypothetical protein VIF15_18475 [Polyangiaceae bacterium]|jgi:hypothetical protein
MKTFVVVAALVAASSAVGACVSTPDPGKAVSVTGPDYTGFAGDGTANNVGVHAFLERRCGTLDCHGQAGRPFRVYSGGGLRLANDAGLLSGQGSTTPDEVFANYEALVGLQPEQLALVLQGKDVPTSLLVVAKPLALQTHKGGPVLAVADSGDHCLEGWLLGANSEYVSYCNMAAQVP